MNCHPDCAQLRRRARPVWRLRAVRRQDPRDADQVHHRLRGQEALRREDRRDRREGRALAHRQQRGGGPPRRQAGKDHEINQGLGRLHPLVRVLKPVILPNLTG